MPAKGHIYGSDVRRSLVMEIATQGEYVSLQEDIESFERSCRAELGNFESSNGADDLRFRIDRLLLPVAPGQEAKACGDLIFKECVDHETMTFDIGDVVGHLVDSFTFYYQAAMRRHRLTTDEMDVELCFYTGATQRDTLIFYRSTHTMMGSYIGDDSAHISYLGSIEAYGPPPRYLYNGDERFGYPLYKHSQQVRHG